MSTGILCYDADKVECGNCGWTGHGIDLDEMDDFEMRVEAGEPTPAGDCPKCGAFAHVVKPDPAPKALLAFADNEKDREYAKGYPKVTAKHPRPWFQSCEGDVSTIYDANDEVVFSVPWDGLEAEAGGVIDALNSLLDMQPAPEPLPRDLLVP